MQVSPRLRLIDAAANERLASTAAALVLAATILIGTTASATPAQGFTYTFAPLAYKEQAWLLVQAVERSDPNTAAATGMLPSMTRQRVDWLIVDGDARQICRVRAIAADPTPADLRAQDGGPARSRLMVRLRSRCGAALRDSPSWLGTEPTAALRWSADRVCVGERCAASSAVQRSRNGVASVGVAGASPAPARCVADRWLIVANMQLEDGGDLTEGALFPGLPPALRGDIVGFEVVRIDGITTMPAELSCP
jgi:hypothetical protein